MDVVTYIHVRTETLPHILFRHTGHSPKRRVATCSSTLPSAPESTHGNDHLSHRESQVMLCSSLWGWSVPRPALCVFLCCHFCFRSFLCSCLREHAPPWGWVVKTVAEALSYGVAGLLRGNCFRKRGGGFFCAPRPEEAGGRQRPPLRSNGPRWAAPSTCSNARTIRSSNVLMPPTISVLKMFLAPNEIRDGRF